MSVIFVLLPLALVLAAVAVAAFVWATRSGQFDDLETPRFRALHDDAPAGARRRRGDRASRDDARGS